MKRLSVLCILSLAVMTIGKAQQNAGLEIALSSGYVFPSSPMTFANYWKTQMGGCISAGIALSPSMTVVGSVEYYRFKLNEDGISSGFDAKYVRDIWIFSDVTQNPSAAASSIMTVAASVRVAPPALSGMLCPYVLAGAGVMVSNLSEISLPTTSVLPLDGTNVSITAQRRIVGGKESTAFVQGGIGMDARLNDLMKIFIEARLALGMSRNLGTAYVPLTAGVRFEL